MKRYENFVGLTEVKAAQARVVERERKFIEQQELRREAQAKIMEVQKKIKVSPSLSLLGMKYFPIPGHPRGVREDPPRGGQVLGAGHTGAPGVEGREVAAGRVQDVGEG